VHFFGYERYTFFNGSHFFWQINQLVDVTEKAVYSERYQSAFVP
jgi:hypothetical protein